MDAAIENSAMRKIYLRLLPFAVLSYILAYIDRINVSFAALTMQGDLKLTATDFGFALGTFFLGYFIFEANHSRGPQRIIGASPRRSRPHRWVAFDNSAGGCGATIK